MKTRPTKASADLQALLKDAESQGERSRACVSALAQVDDNERSWAENFAKPMIAKRHQVDSGDTTVSDLQIFYLQHDPASWINKSTAILDQANQAVHKALGRFERFVRLGHDVEHAASTTVGTLFAVLLGASSLPNGEIDQGSASTT